MKELIRLLIMIFIGYCFLFNLPNIITKIEYNLNKSVKKKNQSLILSSIIILVIILYIVFIQLTIPNRVHYRLILTASSLIFSMIRFTQDDYNSIGKTKLSSIFNSILTVYIVIDMIRIVI